MTTHYYNVLLILMLPRDSMPGERGVKYVSLHEPSGYGVAARRYLSALVRSGMSLTWAPMVPGRAWGLGYEPYYGDVGGAELASVCNRRIAYDTVLVHTVPEYFPLWRALERGKRLIGYTTWETTRIPDHWPALLDAVDLLVVPSRWNCDVFREHGVTVPIEVVPHIVHPGPFPQKQSQSCRVFYAIGPWTARKAMWSVIEAFCRAFRAGEAVQLVVKTSPEDFTRGRLARSVLGARAAALRVLRRYPNHPPVEVVTRTYSEAEVDALHAFGDCFVSLSRGEGWSIPAFDAAAFGNAVVTPRFGGPLEYLSPESAFFVDCDLAPVVDRRAPRSYALAQRWAVANVDSAARLLRAVYECPTEARRRAEVSSREVRERFAEGPVIEKLISVL